MLRHLCGMPGSRSSRDRDDSGRGVRRLGQTLIFVGTVFGPCLEGVAAADEPKRTVQPAPKAASGETTAASSTPVAKQPPRAGEDGFRAVMPDGAIVELVGLCQYPPARHDWWRPDGSPLGQMPGGESPANFQRREWLGPMLREFAIKATLPEGAEVTFVSQNSSNQSSTFSKPGADKKVTQWVRRIVQLSPNSRMTMAVHYAPEPWRKEAEYKHWATLPGGRRVRAGGGFLVRSNPSSEVILAQPYEQDGTTWMVSTYDFDDLPRRDVRILAVSTDKSERPADDSFQPPTRRAHFLMVGFKRPLDSIEKFRFQSRRMAEIEFRNISLHPGQKTNFEVLVGPSPPKAMPEASPRPRRGQPGRPGGNFGTLSP
jgi:hypothetical protein